MQYFGAISKMTEDLCSFPRQTVQYHSNITAIQVYASNTNAEEAEVEWFYDDVQELLELTPKKECLFHHR